MTDRTRDSWTCPRCGSPRWVSASLNEGLTRIPQCVPCGHYDASVLITSIGQFIEPVPRPMDGVEDDRPQGAA